MALAVLSPIEAAIGRRIRLRRAVLGVSQKQLGQAVGLTPQQIQKYEKGTNRISASMLYAIAEALNVPIAFFYTRLGTPSRNPGNTAAFAALADRRETLDLLRAYRGLGDPALRRQFVAFVRHIARAGESVPH